MMSKWDKSRNIVGKEFATDVYKVLLFHHADVGMSERVTGSFYQSGTPTRLTPWLPAHVWWRRRGAFPSISWSGASRRCTRLATSPSPDSTGRHGELQYCAKPAPRPPAAHQLWGGDAPDAEKSRVGSWQGILGRGPFGCHGLFVGRQRDIHLHRL